MEKDLFEVLSLAYILFRNCMKTWNISLDRMSVLVKDFNLVSYVTNFEDYLNEITDMAGVREIENYIKESGGTIV